MDNKILQQNLADALADRTNITKRKAEAFVRSFFEATEDALINDGIVKVKGFGTTKIISVSERESVNINTGERFQIEGHDKITFTPDPNFRDLVNRPFAHFSTIVLEDTVDENELATEVFTDEEDNTVQDEETAEEETAIVEENTVVEETAAAEEPTTVEVPAVVEEQIAEEPIAEEAETTIVVPIETPAATSLVDEEPLIEIPTESDGEENNPSLNPENETDMQQQPIIIQNSMPTPPSHNWWKTAFIILITIVLMVLSYFAGYYRIFCPCHTPAPVAPADTITEKIDTTVVDKEVLDEATDQATAEAAQNAEAAQKAAEQKAAEEAEKAKKAEAEKQQKAANEKNAAAKYKQMGGEYLITGVLERHTMKAGDNLYKLAYKAYGDKKLATYIIFHNNIENPDVIGLGQVIEIPKLTKK